MDQILENAQQCPPSHIFHLIQLILPTIVWGGHHCHLHCTTYVQLSLKEIRYLSQFTQPKLCPKCKSRHPKTTLLTSGSQAGTILPAHTRPPAWVFGSVSRQFGCHNSAGRVACQYLVGSGQGCYYTSYNTQKKNPITKVIQPSTPLMPRLGNSALTHFYHSNEKGGCLQRLHH